MFTNFPSCNFSQGASKIYDFLQGTLNSEITFSRSSTATMYNSSGYLVYAPANLLVYSNSFSNAAWTKYSVSATYNVGPSPDGSNDATQFIATAQYGNFAQYINFLGSTKYNFSCWIKLISGSSSLVLEAYDGTSHFDQSIAATGSWQRFSLSFTTAASPTAGSTYVDINDQSTSSWGTYQIYGAQLEVYSYNSPQTYNPTTTAAFNGPRFDYDPVLLKAKGLLIENTSTNLCYYSNNFTNSTGWLAVSSTITSNYTTSPDNTSNASLLLTSTGTSNLGSITYTFTTVSVPYTISAYAKYVNSQWVKIFFYRAYTNAAWFDVLNGTLGTATSGGSDTVSSSMQNVGNGWYRLSMTFTQGTAGGGCYITTSTGNNSTTTNAGSSVLIYGFQIEQAASATSYIPTISTAQPVRSPDLAYVGSLPWFSSGSGSFVVNVMPQNSTVANYPWILNFSGGSSELGMYAYSGGADVKLVSSGTNVLETPIVGSAFTVGSLYKLGFSYSLGSQYYTYNGSTPTSHGAIASVPSGISSLYIMTEGTNNNTYNGWIQKVQYWNYNLSSGKLQSVTL